MGLKDDHDMGFKLTTSRGNCNFALAYFMQAATGGTDFAPANTRRYSYNIVSAPDQGQSNHRKQTSLMSGPLITGNTDLRPPTEIETSLQYGGIYNSVL